MLTQWINFVDVTYLCFLFLFFHSKATISGGRPKATYSRRNQNEQKEKERKKQAHIEKESFDCSLTGGGKEIHTPFPTRAFFFSSLKGEVVLCLQFFHSVFWSSFV